GVLSLIEDGVALLLELARSLDARFVGVRRRRRDEQGEGKGESFHRRGGFRGLGLALEIAGGGATLAEGFAVGFTAIGAVGFGFAAVEIAGAGGSLVGVGSVTAGCTIGTTAVSTGSTRAGAVTSGFGRKCAMPTIATAPSPTAPAMATP